MGYIMVTGGAGYIGRQIIKEFSRNGYEVLSIDWKSSNHIQDARVSPIVVDVTDITALNSVFDNYVVELVVHCAGELGIEKSFDDPYRFYRQNIYATDVLLCTMLQHSVNNIIYSSSAAVYKNSNLPCTETSLLANNPSPYAASKMISEERLTSAAQLFGLHVVIFRYFNVVGSDKDKGSMEFYMSKSNLFPNIVKAISLGNNIFINGANYSTPDGTCIRDYIDVRDIARLHYQAGQEITSGKVTGIYNVGTGRAYSVLDVVHEFEKIFKKNIAFTKQKARKGDAPYLCADTKKMANVFNFECRYDLHRTITDLCDYVPNDEKVNN